MTEKTGILAKHEHHLIDPVGFFVALIGAPVLVTLASFWLLMIPVAALFMGGPIFLVTATPVLLWWLGRHEPDAAPIAGLGFVANLGVTALIYLAGLRAGQSDASNLAMIYLIFGSVFAPVWSAVFAWLYRWLRRPFYTQII